MSLRIEKEFFQQVSIEYLSIFYLESVVEESSGYLRLESEDLNKCQNDCVCVRACMCVGACMLVHARVCVCVCVLVHACVCADLWKLQSNNCASSGKQIA